MRTYDAATTAYLSADSGIAAGTIQHRLIWIVARTIGTGAPAALGVWSGEYDLTIDVDGAARTYIGAGQVLEAEPVTAGPGLDVRAYRARLSAVSPEVEALVRGYETRFAAAEVHRLFLAPATRAPVGAPSRVFAGMVNSLTFPREVPGATPSCDVELVSETRALTRTLAQRKSDEDQKARGGDRFARYANVSGSVPVYWGELRD